MLKTKHKLEFLCRPWRFDRELYEFQVGTIAGLWRATDTAYQIIAIVNNNKNNGHFEDVLEWFETSCKRDNKDLEFVEIWNGQFEKHLIEKRGFEPIENGVRKKFCKE